MELSNKFLLSIKEASIFTGLSESTIKRLIAIDDFVEGIWKILQHNKPDDFVISTAKMLSVKNFVNRVAKKFNLNIYWKGRGLKEKAILKNSKKVIVRINQKYYRPTEVDALCGDFRKADKVLKWKPKISIDELIEDMINNDL